CENFKITAIRLAAYDDALIGIVPVLAIGVGHAHADIANTVINTSIRAERHARHAVAAKADMNCKAVSHRGSGVGLAITVSVFCSPGVGANGEIHLIALIVIIDTA